MRDPKLAWLRTVLAAFWVSYKQRRRFAMAKFALGMVPVAVSIHGLGGGATEYI